MQALPGFDCASPVFFCENNLSQNLEIAIGTYLRIPDKKAVIPVTGCFPVQLGV
jgi:hypothetical protein